MYIIYNIVKLWASLWMVDSFLSIASKHGMILLLCGLSFDDVIEGDVFYIHIYPAYQMATRAIITPVAP